MDPVDINLLPSDRCRLDNFHDYQEWQESSPKPGLMDEDDDKESIVELLDDPDIPDATSDKPTTPHSRSKRNSTPSLQSSLTSPVSEIGSSIASSKFTLQERKSSTLSLQNAPSESPTYPQESHDENVASVSRNRQSWQPTKQTSVRSRPSSAAALERSSETSSGINGDKKHNKTMTSTEVTKRPVGGTGQVMSTAPLNRAVSSETAATVAPPSRTAAIAVPLRASNARPVIMDRSLPRLPPPPKRLPPSLDHVRKANSRFNMSFDNQMFYQIVKDNLYLADRIQNAKSSYTKDASEPPKIVKSKLEARESKELYNLARENLRISQRIIAARSTIPSPSRSQSVSRISTRPSSAASSATFNMSSRAPSLSNISRVSNSRPAWNDRWQYT